MCGIVGLFMPHGTPAPDVDLGRATDSMTHRGPDGRDTFETERGDYLCGFRRLAIIDLATGDQPLIEDGSGRVLIGNGEIYNYVELRQQFNEYAYRTTGDMETVLAASRALGPNYVDALNGMYALALYDANDHGLDLVRDRLGVKPLYWAETSGGGTAFASEIKALFALGAITPSINEAAVNQYLAHGYVPGPATLFKGVNKLLPGQRMRIGRDGTRTIETYWCPRPTAGLPDTDAAIKEYLRHLLADSVRLQLRSDVPVGALLSGGIDSGMIVAMAAEQASEPLRTFTVRFDGSRIDETPLAGEVAARYGTEHEVIDVVGADAAEHLLKLVWFAEEPLNDAALLPNYLIQKELSKHVRVTLSGTGGDELFAGYGRYFQLPVEQTYLRIPGPIRRHLIEPTVGAFNPMRAWQLARADLFDSDRGSYVHAHATHFPAPIRRLIGNSVAPPTPAQKEYFNAFMTKSDCPQSGALAADIGTYLVDDLLTLVDRSAMAVSVEGRVPLLDHRLVEAALAVPAAFRTPAGRQKGLLRDMARDYLPDSLISAPKHGFVSPVPGWIRSGLGETARQLLCAPNTLARGWWTAAGIDRLLAEPDQHGYRIYTLMALELSVRMFIDSTPPNTPPSVTLQDYANA